VLSITVTSAFWIALGAWLFHAHVIEDHGGSRALAREVRGAGTPHTGFLSGLVGGAPGRSDHGARRSATAWGGAAGTSPGLSIPVAGVRADKLVDTFAQARDAGARPHDAIDIQAPEGTPVLAAAPGRLEKLFFSDAGGNTAYIRSPDRRRIFYYAHLSAYAPGLREGMAVRRGELLGTVGHTGNASPDAPHLHFAVWMADPAQGWSQRASAIDPYPLLGGRSGQPSAPPTPH
jgi:murein DD-endopeptidase MepM/ murein hydrolase activator NlpD